MAGIKFSRKEFEKRVKITKEIEEKIAMMGTPLESLNKEEIEIDITANRPDLLSLEGYLRAFEAFIGKKGSVGIKNYKIKKTNYRLICKDLPLQWPYAVACIIKGLKLNNERVKDIIQLQEKLGNTILRGRKKGGAGLYPLKNIKFPVVFEGREWERVIFKPLEMNDYITAKKILELHPKGRKYSHICQNWKRVPVFVNNDGKGEIMSMPPIINSQDWGAIDEKTKDVFLEVTGNDLKTIEKTLIIMATALADMGGTIHQIECIQENGEKSTQPNLEEERMKINNKTIKELIGIEVKEEEMKELMERAGYGYDKKNKVAIIPAWRVDIIHEYDIVGDLAIAYGYEKIKPVIPSVSTIGEESEKTIFCRKISQILIGLGMEEILSYNLLRDNEVKKILRKKDLLEVGDSKTEYKYLRSSLMPGIMRILSENVDAQYPHKIFEIGTTFKEDNRIETGVAETTKLAMASTPNNYTEAKQSLDYLMRMIGINYEIEKGKKKGLIKGRVGKIIVGGVAVGFIGEVHPATLKNFKLKESATIIEISLKKLWEEINN